MKNGIEIYKKLVPVKTCDALIRLMEENMSKSYPGTVSVNKTSSIKKTIDIDLKNIASEDLIADIVKALKKAAINYFKEYKIYPSEHKDELLAFSSAKFHDVFIKSLFSWDQSSLHIKKYNVGDYFNWHIDRGNSSWLNYSRELVFQIYLNEGCKGGETQFKFQDVSIKPSVGAVLVFPAGFTHKHRGAKVTQGTKYIYNCCLMQNNPALKNKLSNQKNWMKI